MTYQVHGVSASGNCHKVRLVLEQLNLPYVWHEVDMMAGATRTDEFKKLNPTGSNARRCCNGCSSSSTATSRMSRWRVSSCNS